MRLTTEVRQEKQRPWRQVGPPPTKDAKDVQHGDVEEAPEGLLGEDAMVNVPLRVAPSKSSS